MYAIVRGFRRTFITAIAAVPVVAALAASAGCFADTPADVERDGRSLSGKLVVTGSSTVAPLAAEIGQRFESLHPDARIDVQTGGSSRGIADARNGLADIGMVSRALEPAESDLSVHPIAVDGVCIIVHQENPIQSLTDEEIVAIYTGKTENWHEVGGMDGPIVVVNKADGRATLEVFLEHYKLEGSQITADVIIGDNQQGIKTVAANPLAIAYVSIGAADFEARSGTAIKLLDASGVAATTQNVSRGEFPITRPLNFVTQGEPKPLAEAFIEFAQSPQVHDIIEAQYFVPIDE
jgi:phosphate transport system substrate-binding protein